MARLSSAKRYAQAVFDIARDRKEVDLWDSDLQVLEDTLKNEELRAFLERASIPMSTKVGVVREAFQGVSKLAQNLLCLLASRGRLELLPQIREQYLHHLNSYHGREETLVVSAVPLDSREREMVSNLLRGIVNKEIVLHTRVDPEILGGLIIQFGGKYVDGSVRGKLHGLRRELTGDDGGSAP
jgi:F-type H+-transporting ATPase subunit delta